MSPHAECPPEHLALGHNVPPPRHFALVQNVLSFKNLDPSPNLHFEIFSPCVTYILQVS